MRHRDSPLLPWYGTIYVPFNVPPLFIVPPPIGREHVSRGSVPPSRLTGGWYPTEVATRRGEGEAYADTSAGAKRVQSAQLLSRPVLVARHSTSKSARRLASARPAARGASALLSFVGSTLCSRPRSAEARPSSVGLVRSYASRNTDTNTRDTATVPPSWEHADVPPSLKCTPLLRLYPLPWSRSTIGYIKTHIDGRCKVAARWQQHHYTGTCPTQPLRQRHLHHAHTFVHSL